MKLQKAQIIALPHPTGAILRPHDPRRMSWRLNDISSDRHDPVHLYFVINEIAKKGDWVIDEDLGLVQIEDIVKEASDVFI